MRGLTLEIVLDDGLDASDVVQLEVHRSPAGGVEPLAGPVKTVAGTDCAFAQDGKKIIAAAVLCDADTKLFALPELL